MAWKLIIVIVYIDALKVYASVPHLWMSNAGLLPNSSQWFYQFTCFSTGFPYTYAMLRTTYVMCVN